MVKLDLVMWTKNGEPNLYAVLKRLNQVIPKDFINRKIIVDDNSVDSTKAIATFCGWEVHRNKGAGISDGANTALGLVESDYFCSFEQDVILAKDWWSNVVVPFFLLYGSCSVFSYQSIITNLCM
jgi:glycosyltransferase involved in cell wall biosynthesis